MTFSYGMIIQVLSVHAVSTMTTDDQISTAYTIMGLVKPRGAPYPYVTRLQCTDTELCDDSEPVCNWEGHSVSVYLYPLTNKIAGRILKAPSGT